MSISPADPLQPIPPTFHSPSGGERLVKSLYNPTYLAILLSVGIHGLAVASIPAVTSMVRGGQQPPRGPRETNIVQLTRAEAARVNSAFPAAKTTSLPPGLPYLNPNAPTATSVTPPPLAGDLLASKSGGTVSPWSWQPYPEDAGVADSSGEASASPTSDMGDLYGASSGAVEEDGGVYTGGGNTEIASSDLPADYPGNANSVDLREWWRNYNNSRTAPENRNPNPNPVGNKKKIALNDRKPDTPPNPPQTSKPADTPTSPNSPDDLIAALENAATYVGSVPGMRTEQAAVQALEGNYPVLFVRNPDGSVDWAYLGDDPIARAAIEYTLTKNPPDISDTPGSYRYDYVYPAAPGSQTPSDVAEVAPTVPAQIPTENPELVALQEEYPDSETIAYPSIAILSEVAGTTQVAITLDAEGNPKATLLQSSGNRDLDLRAIEEAQSRWDSSSASTIQTFEIEFAPDTSQPPAEKPPLPQAPTSDTPAPEASGESESAPTPKPAPEASGESNVTPTPKPAPEASGESDIEPVAPTPEAVEESSPELAPEASEESNFPPKEKVPLNNTDDEAIETPLEEPVEETPSEPAPVLPKKPLLNQQSALPSLEN